MNTFRDIGAIFVGCLLAACIVYVLTLVAQMIIHILMYMP